MEKSFAGGNRAGKGCPCLGSQRTKDGKYVIVVPGKIMKPVLLFSFVGMTSKEVPYLGNSEINVTLEEEQAEINEVVVTGMFNRQGGKFYRFGYHL